MSEAEARRKDKPQELAAKKMQAVTEETREPEPATAADDFKIDYRAAARDALNRVQQELVTIEIEQKVKLELENEKLQEQLNTFEATEFKETKAPSSLSMKLNVISGQRFGILPQGSKIQSIISVAGHQVIRNLSEPSEFTLMNLDTCRLSEAGGATHRVESCASTTNDGWPSHEETSWTLPRGLWAVSSDAERGWNQYLHQNLCNNR